MLPFMMIKIKIKKERDEGDKRKEKKENFVHKTVGVGRLELPTSASRTLRSCHLSYTPINQLFLFFLSEYKTNRLNKSYYIIVFRWRV